MVEIKEVLKKFKSDKEYITAIEFADFALDRCMCTVVFASLCDNKCKYNQKLIELINDYILAYDAILDPFSTSHHTSIIFTIKL